jgi:hypothetical protein
VALGESTDLSIESIEVSAVKTFTGTVTGRGRATLQVTNTAGRVRVARLGSGSGIGSGFGIGPGAKGDLVTRTDARTTVLTAAEGHRWEQELWRGRQPRQGQR